MLVRTSKGDWEIPLNATYIGKVDTAARLVELLSIDELEPLPRKKTKAEKLAAKSGEAPVERTESPSAEKSESGDAP